MSDPDLLRRHQLGGSLALRLDDRQFARLSGARPERSGWSTVGVLLAVISAAVTVAVLTGLAFAVWLIVVDPNFQRVALGIVLLFLVAIFRPRLGRLPAERERISYAEVPELFDLVSEVAQALHCKVPDYIVLDLGRGASVEYAGLKRELVLRLGGELWVVLTPQQRIALVAHELGHTVNGDPTRTLISQPVLAAFGRLAEWTGANRTLREIFNPEGTTVLPEVGGPRYVMVRRMPRYVIFGELILWTVSRVFLLPYLLLVAVAAPGRRRAEYLADGMSAQIAGTDAAICLLDKLLLFREIDQVVFQAAAHRRPAQWLAIIDAFVAGRSEQLPELRSFDTVHTDLWASHPPAGRRAEMLLAWPHYEPSLTTEAHTQAELDEELGGWMAAVHGELLGTRDFHDRSAQGAV